MQVWLLDIGFLLKSIRPVNSHAAGVRSCPIADIGAITPASRCSMTNVTTGDLCRESHVHQFVAKVHQNAPNRVLHFINNPGVIPGPRHPGGSATRPPVRKGGKRAGWGRRGQLRREERREGWGRKGGRGGEREKERESLFAKYQAYNVLKITYNGRLPERHTPIYAGHLWQNNNNYT